MHREFGPGILFSTDWSYMARRLDMCVHHAIYMALSIPKLIPRPVVCTWLFSLGMRLVYIFSLFVIMQDQMTLMTLSGEYSHAC